MSGQSNPPSAPEGGVLIPMAAYVRMSTEHQQYSTDNQLDRIKEYAARRGMTIVRIFADEGKSGLSVKHRDGLRNMIAEVESGRADFRGILAYDVSRWGRFQDADESGYYEYICKRAGFAVHYCAEQFENDGSPTSNIIKSVKRSMAGEYSRELSTKVFQGACRLIQLGFKQGGAAGYGLRRMLIDQTGKHKGTLKIGEHKSLQTDRVILVSGPDQEQEIVREIYHSFVDEKKTEREIADSLNARKIETDLGRAWTRGSVHQILTNEKYIGNNVYHRTSFKLKRKHVANPPEMWIRAERAFPAIVDPSLFARAQEIILARAKRYSDDEMLRALKDLCSRHGRVSGLLIDEEEAMPSSSAFRYRFGSLIRAYQLIGYTPPIDYSFIEINRYLRARHPEIVQNVISTLSDLGVSVARDQLMVTANNYARAYAEALIIGTPADQLADSGKSKAVKGLSHEEIVRMEKEMEGLERDYKLHQDQFGENSLHLNAAQRYVKRLLENTKIKRFLGQRHGDLLDEFQEFAAMESL